LLSSCSGRGEALYSLGGFLFVVFLFAISVTYAIKHFHTNEKIRDLVLKLNVPAIIVSWFLYLFSVIILVFGFFELWTEGFYPEKLTFFWGVTVFLLAHFIRKWARSPIESKGHYARLASISFGFSVALLYIILGAPSIKA
jgi:hypothetical protein